MALRHACLDTVAMNSNTKSIPPRGGSVDLAARKFSKARSIAERLGICPRTIFRWADAGKITRYKVNQRVVLFSEVEVVAYVESGRI
jgi:excisionase family DNA binding protein